MDPSPRVMETKAKINKWDLIKLKIDCRAKETISKMKRQPMEWEKLLVNGAIDKGLIPKHTISSYNSITTTKTTNQITQ